jgi:hypothetical protein
MFCVSCFSTAPDCNRRGGGVYIKAFLGQTERLETKMDGNGGSRPQRVWVARPSRRPVPPVLVQPLGLVSWTSSPPGASRDKILTLQKSEVNLSLGRFLKLQNTQNRVFCFAEL